jgi:GxxExxY protein
MFEPIPQRAEAAARLCVNAAVTVHKRLGPGLLETVYEQCLAHELRKAQAPHRRQATLPILYDGLTLDAGYRVDLLVDESLVVAVKSVQALAPIHEAQMLTYLKLSGLRLGLLLNFNVVLMKEGIRRFVL